MLARQLIRSGQMQARMMQPVIMQRPVRLFGEYVDPGTHENWYTPKHPMEFSNNQFTFFSDENVTEKRYVPYPVKEATLKGGLYVVGLYMLDLLNPLY